MKILPPQLALIGLAAMALLRLAAPGPILLPPVWRGAGLLPGLAGVVLLLAGSTRFRRLGTNIRTFDEPGVLVTDGLFRVTRNPMYLGFVLALLGAGLAMGALTPLFVPVAFLIVANAWYIPFEERALEAKFGEAYAHYRRRTRRWL
ncbi:MAG: isoprenylcysteine carboxylmethyltransferase family protein [Proteobacteria bacterium]|nr:isoprenylcysteine carboxylmethyltransferase family protein [Pseudomonadota bacterium]